ncbi:MAG: molecular chaperone HtpG [Pseudomonadota bacterium]
MSETTTTETLAFEAEVARLLHMMVHSVYAEREVFLRELISNASDACDRLRHAALTQPELTADAPDFKIAITVDKAAGCLTIADNGIGMNRADLIDNLGTIARSGTARFVEQLSGNQKADMSLIGQFGVGFYSVFMVADKVTVLTRRAGDGEAWTWASDGLGAYSIAPGKKDARGTSITLFLKGDAKNFLERQTIEKIVRTYSDHIAVPITLDAGDGKPQAVNSGAALWARPKADISEAQYAEFYRHVSGAFDKPALTIHFRAEGRIEYTGLLFVPETPPFDLFDPARKARVKLYVKRVFITDDVEDLIPGYLRFLRGLVDAQDLPLNISREMLQNNPVVAVMRKAIAGRVLGELKKYLEADPKAYESLWAAYGKVLKEGLYEDAERREELLRLARFRSTKVAGWTSLEDYVARMADKQGAIYTISGDSLAALQASPQLEGFKARGVEVLLMTDPVDDFWLPAVGDYGGKPFKSVTRGGADLKDLGAPEAKAEAAPDAATATLIAALKTALGDGVKDVRASDRLTDSAVCLVADEAGLDLHIERLLKAHDRLEKLTPRILEINPGHPLIKALAARAGKKDSASLIADAAHLLLDQARVLEGETLPDANAFARRMADVMMKALG